MISKNPYPPTHPDQDEKGSRAEFGEVAWGGRSLPDARDLMTSEQVVRMREMGLSGEGAVHWQDFYEDIHAKSVARFPNNPEKVNPSALARAALFQYYVSTIEG